MGGKLSKKSNEVDDSVKLSFVNRSGRVAQVILLFHIAIMILNLVIFMIIVQVFWVKGPGETVLYSTLQPV
jgi:hypothetical protein